MALNIYLVEDNPLIRENLVSMLGEMANATFFGCADGEKEAIGWLSNQANSWDVAIVDLFLKQGNGLGVVHQCQSRNADQKVIVLTNYATPQIRKRCLELGADAVFDKSNDIEKLVEFCVKNGRD